MTNDISGYGLIVTVVASVTFPAGFQVTQFADDSDPLDMGSIQIADKAMGLNGDMVTWARAVPLPAVLAVIPGSDDDVNLSILAEANRVGKGKAAVGDIITLNILYPDGTTTNLIQGKMTDAMFGKSVASAGRLKSKPYVFAFQNKIGA